MSKSKKASKQRVDDASSDSELSHNPFGELQRLSGSVKSVAEVALQAPEILATPTRFPKTLVLRREVKGRGGKTVTRILGIPKQELPVLAKQMKKALGCGASVDGADILLLGSLVDRAAQWLSKAGAGNIVKGN